MKFFKQSLKGFGALVVLSAILTAGVPVWADDNTGGKTTNDLTSVSLSDLAGLNVVVTSSSKKAESLRDATSAIFVITADDIRRSGAKTVADLLAMVPGVQVARQNGDQWAISARGFNSQYNDKMLVLIDGRSVFDPVLGGVNWDQQDVMLEDIDHIEVIRGPGGTLWGSNAVNGIVNIITKDAKLTQGLYLSTGDGVNLYPAGASGANALNSNGAFRWGGKAGDDLYYRVYGQFNNQAPMVNPDTVQGENQVGSTWNDAWNDFRAGFRSDLHKDNDQITLEAEGQKGYFNYAELSTNNVEFFNPSTFQPFSDINTDVDQNAHILARWTRDYADDSQIQAFGYYDYNNLATTGDGRIENMGQVDLEFQHRFHVAGFNEITWGASYRNVADQFFNQIAWYYASLNQNTYSGFLQDKLTLVDSRLYLTGGVKLENNPYTGDEWQPSGRLLFLPDDNTSVWAAVSRAVHTPTQLAASGYLYFYGIPAGTVGPGTPAYFSALVPNPNLQSETLVSYELGFRNNPTKDTSLDIASFYNHYERLIAIPSVSGVFNVPGGVVDPSSPVGGAVQEINSGTGDIYGVETSAKWEPSSNLHVALAYSYQDYDQAMINSSNVNLGGLPPHNLASCRLTYEPVKGLELTNDFYYTDATFLPDANSGSFILPDYVRWNLGADLKANDNLELALWGLDLEGAHTETIQSYGVFPTNIVPQVYGQMTVRY